MFEENLDLIIECLELRKKGYEKNSETYSELNNTIDMLKAKCYRK